MYPATASVTTERLCSTITVPTGLSSTNGQEEVDNKIIVDLEQRKLAAMLPNMSKASSLPGDTAPATR
eukprot:1502729-Pleurochrysis_carterae.AAC.1